MTVPPPAPDREPMGVDVNFTLDDIACALSAFGNLLNEHPYRFVPETPRDAQAVACCRRLAELKGRARLVITDATVIPKEPNDVS